MLIGQLLTKHVAKDNFFTIFFCSVSNFLKIMFFHKMMFVCDVDCSSPTGRGGAKRGKKSGSQKRLHASMAGESTNEVEGDLEVDALNLGGEESIHENEDNLLAPLEANLEIVPYIFQPEIVTIDDNKEENKLFIDKGEDILQKVRLFSCFSFPPIPLCRLIPHAKVRDLRDDLSGLKSAFGKEGYVAEKGAFIVSLWTTNREETFVTDDVMSAWDDCWREVNEEFDQELQTNEEFKNLMGKMFYVWEGNHRTVAWMAAIKERFSNTKAKHCRILCTIIDPTKVPELALITSLQRMN